ncbi:hypothetical protein LCGC14_1084110 [marine sediment metagenome]|uniref:Nucleoside 2-deoxyribosyltransferase n=1 Tax=marine sediment metagenome TaxID=412755 RepID=A0A0F9QKB4_9ZZZZ
MSQIKKHRAYFSHIIRGKLGVNATSESMKFNNEKACSVAVLMRCVLPEISIYVPGENDLLISILYQDGRLKEEDILWGDCQIVKACDILIAFSPDGFISTGMRIEIDFANKHNIPVFIVKSAEGLMDIRATILKYLLRIK